MDPEPDKPVLSDPKKLGGGGMGPKKTPTPRAPPLGDHSLDETQFHYMTPKDCRDSFGRGECGPAGVIWIHMYEKYFKINVEIAAGSFAGVVGRRLAGNISFTIDAVNEFYFQLDGEQKIGWMIQGTWTGKKVSLVTLTNIWTYWPQHAVVI